MSLKDYLIKKKVPGVYILGGGGWVDPVLKHLCSTHADPTIPVHIPHMVYVSKTLDTTLNIYEATIDTCAFIPKQFYDG